jgi:hypothetical protein
MNIRYNRIVAGGMLALALINVFLGGWLLLLGNFHFSIALGALFLFIAVMYFQRPYFILLDKAVVVPALIGPIKREFYFGSAENIRFNGGKLEVNTDGTWKRVLVFRWMAHSDDWSALESRLRQ